MFNRQVINLNEIRVPTRVTIGAISSAIGFILSIFGTTAFADSWGTGGNNPDNLGIYLNKNLAQLPAESSVAEKNIPWSDTYWPSDHGSIAYRWNSTDPGNAWKNRLYSETEVMGMTVEMLKELSPAEKYDIFMGDFSYPMTRNARANSSPRAPDWAGICHGWSPASIQNPEPLPVVKKGRSGIQVPFGSSDVKGLMSYYYAMFAGAETRQVGMKCNHKVLPNSPYCADIHAGAFHVILANLVGLQKQAFVADVDRMNEIWNNPVYAYRSTYSYSPGQTRVHVVTDMTYTDEIETPLYQAVVGTPQFAKDVKHMAYTLELNSSGEITGGEWDRGSDRPDFVWMIKNNQRVAFEGVHSGVDFSGINAIYEPRK